MKRFLRFLLIDRPWMVAAAAAAILLLLLWLTLWASGALTSVAFDENQNIQFEAALRGPPPLPALAAARDVDTEFAEEMRNQLADAANGLLRSGEPPAFERTRATNAVEARWIDTYVCGLIGWGEESAVMRKLVSEGLGDCGQLTRFGVNSPLIYDYGFVGGLGVALLWLALIVAIGGAILLYLTRRAYHWLYASRLL